MKTNKEQKDHNITPALFKTFKIKLVSLRSCTTVVCEAMRAHRDENIISDSCT